MTETRKTSILFLAWAAAMPLLLVGTAPFWHWLAAAHYYTAPLLFVGHFLFAVAGILTWCGHRRAGAWVAVAGTMAGLVVAVAAIFMIGGFGRVGSAVPLGNGARDFLYLLHGFYAAGHCLVVYVGFRGWRRPPEMTLA